MGERGEGPVVGERVEERVPGGNVTGGGRDVCEHGEGRGQEEAWEGGVESDERVGDGRVGGRTGLERPSVEGLAVAGAGGAAEVLDELRVGYLARESQGRRPCH